MKSLLYLFSLLVLVRSQPPNDSDDTVNVYLINYQAMYDNECATTTSTPTSSTTAPPPSVATTPSPVHGWEKYEKKYEDKYTNKYEGNGNPGSVSGNKIGGDNGNAEQQQTSTFCKCLAQEQKAGKGYAASQNSFSKCIDQANGNNAKHWEKVSEKYQHKFGIKTHWGPEITTSQTTEIPEIGSTVDSGSEDANAILFEANDNKSYGNVAVYVTFIGSSVLLFICVWFIKQSFNKWKKKDYKPINDESKNVCQSDDRSVHYQRNSKKFGKWNQYSSV